MRKIRRLLSVAYGRIKTKILKQITHVMKESGTLYAD
jgi:hypothetical protein